MYINYARSVGIEIYRTASDKINAFNYLAIEMEINHHDELAFAFVFCWHVFLIHFAEWCTCDRYNISIYVRAHIYFVLIAPFSAQRSLYLRASST